MPSVPRIPSTTPWLEILTDFGFPNKPFILESSATDEWPARKNWVLGDGSPNLQYFIDNYGDAIVPILDGDCYEKVVLRDYLQNLDKNPQKYLKDWHFQNDFGAADYKLHPFFARDFVNYENFAKESNPFGDDYRFVYFGFKGSWTKFHSDVVSSHSWSANVCGEKLWLMLEPGKENLFKAATDSGFVEDLREHEDRWEEAGLMKFVQHAGEIVFVPTNWYHQVHNLTDAISINHNWMNCTNIEIVGEFLRRRERDVRNELSDCAAMFDKDEFEQKVELVLFADARLNRSRFRDLLQLLLRNRKSPNFRCPVHKKDLRSCRESEECLKRIRSICTCTNSFCKKCLEFVMKQLSEHELQEIFQRASGSMERGPLDVEPEVFTYYGKIFDKCLRGNSESPISEESSHLSPATKETMIAILRGGRKIEEKPVKWNVNIVVGNKYVLKSLRPVVTMDIPNGTKVEKLEFDLDTFSQFRMQLAKAVMNTFHNQE
ncbi:unnamed protein product [Caenorhabditis bovis]|uniref:Jumonji domain-containing protein 4 n=1 Tax=Caenorhabditis bovis TaxID=2654633 RepID=A0A8S1EN28_9PELO|nr:unnamed protein product [Caenorhabditis bovis]